MRFSFSVRLGISWLTNALVLATVAALLSGVQVRNAGSLLAAALTRDIVSGFQLHGFGTFMAAAIIVWLVNLALDFAPGPWQLTGKRRRRGTRRRRAVD